jgi:hypothetical protein
MPMKEGTCAILFSSAEEVDKDGVHIILVVNEPPHEAGDPMSASTQAAITTMCLHRPECSDILEQLVERVNSQNLHIEILTSLEAHKAEKKFDA